MRVTVKALSHLDDLVTEQDRRRFSQPRRYRTKVSKSRSQLLQHLVCCVAESPQIRQRRDDRTTPKIADDLLIRFVVDLTRIAARRSSFYVNLGISRLLHDYSTSEARAINDFLTQNPERMRNDTYFRYGKGLLLKEMQHRFGSLVETTREARGELRLRSRRPSPRQTVLVNECLRLLTPWETRCPVPESFDPLQEALPELCFAGDHPDDEHPVDMRRMHTVLHPRCYVKATRALGLDAPAERLRIPRFFTGGGKSRCPEPDARGRSDTAITHRQPRVLSIEETATIDAELRAIAQRRRRWSIRQLSS
ncbi:MAG: hypothetical protein GY719_00370 [bacterium]|nr:hypothetical protein [bacterium]